MLSHLTVYNLVGVAWNCIKPLYNCLGWIPHLVFSSVGISTSQSHISEVSVGDKRIRRFDWFGFDKQYWLRRRQQCQTLQAFESFPCVLGNHTGQSYCPLSIRILAAAEILPVAIQETRFLAINTHKHTHFQCCQFLLAVTLSFTRVPIHHLVNSSCQSISVLSFEMSMVAGRMGQVFQFVWRQFFFKLPPHLLGDETNAEPFPRWFTFLHCHHCHLS